MRISRLSAADYRRMPWKNGLGFTTEVAREPAEGAFDWRVSVARVERDGPFSSFAGFDRVILALDGAGMVLTHEEQQASVTLGVLHPWTFSGDCTTHCELPGGPIRDFNVITRRGVFSAVVSILHVDAPATLDLAATTILLYCANGSVAVERHEIAPDETVRIERDEPQESVRVRPVTAPATLVQVVLSRIRN